MSKKAKNKIPLLGADKFILALERHDKHSGSTGNSCQYIIEVDANFDEKAFEQAIQSNEIIQWLASLSLSLNIKKPNQWTADYKSKQTIELKKHNKLFNNNLERIKFNPKLAPLFYFELYKKDESKKTIVFTWHHLLMDGYGAGLLIQNLLDPTKIQPYQRDKSAVNWSNFIKAVKAKRFVSKSAKGKIGMLQATTEENITQITSILSFSRNETTQIEENAKRNGAKFGPSSFFLAATSIAVNEYRNRENLPTEDFWIPVPQNNRKKGERWPILGNHISMLFYRLKKEKYNSLEALTQSIVDQMIVQIKEKQTNHYNHLMNYLRPVNSSIYSRMIKGPNGNSLSSFLFTVASDNNSEMKDFFGGKITNQLSIPPNTFPPGLTFAFNYFNGSLSVIIQSYKHIMDERQMKMLEKDLRNVLLADY